MKHSLLTPAALAIALVLGACASKPTSTTLLESTRNDYSQIQANPDVPTYAALEMKLASDAMQRLNNASAQGAAKDRVDALAELAQQKIAMTNMVVKQKQIEADAARAAKERDEMRLIQRTTEAMQANTNAQQSLAIAQQAQSEAALAQQKAAEAQARSAQLEAQLADLSAKKTERGMVITLGEVLFGTDRASLTPDGLRNVQKLATVLQQNPLRTVLVEGFTDSTGAAAYNQELSERRGMSVRDALLQMGISSERIGVRGYGAAYPVASNDTAAGRQQNRRVEILLSDDTGKTIQR
jgi:outer membrane protein OmpA-like peptidoglycan-associated protein